MMSTEAIKKHQAWHREVLESLELRYNTAILCRRCKRLKRVLDSLISLVYTYSNIA